MTNKGGTMALTGEDHEVLRSMLRDLRSDLKKDYKEEIELTVAPIKETLISHIKHDETNDASVNEHLEELKEGQNSLKSDMRIGRMVGGVAYTVFIGVLISFAKGLL